jgi:hypothetical protein
VQCAWLSLLLCLWAVYGFAGVYDEYVFQGLDYLLAAAAGRGIRVGPSHVYQISVLVLKGAHLQQSPQHLYHLAIRGLAHSCDWYLASAKCQSLDNGIKVCEQMHLSETCSHGMLGPHRFPLQLASLFVWPSK